MPRRGESNQGFIPKGRLWHLGRYLLSWQVHRPGPVRHAIEAQILCDHRRRERGGFPGKVLWFTHRSRQAFRAGCCGDAEQSGVAHKIPASGSQSSYSLSTLQNGGARAKFRRLTHLAMTRQLEKQPNHDSLCCQGSQNSLSSLLEIFKYLLWRPHDGTRAQQH